MKLSQLFLESCSNLIAFKLRSFLSLLGILVGAAAIVAIISGGELATQEALREFKDFDVNLLNISIGYNTDQKNVANNNYLSLDEALSLKKLSSDIVDVAPYTTVYSQLSFNGKNLEGGVIGVTENFANVIGLHVKNGRFIHYLDRYSSYCVIGDKLYQDIKMIEPNPIGKQIQIGDNLFTIIGVINPAVYNVFLPVPLDRAIFVTELASTMISTDVFIYNLIFLIKTGISSDVIKEKITHYFDYHFINSKLYIFSAKEMIEKIKQQREVLTIFLGFISIISLVVGGIGIMNIMLVSVSERKKEIGIRKAIGAKQSDIENMFLIESVLLSFIGGILGVIIGMAIAFLVAEFKHWHYVILIWPALLGLTTSVLTGVFFGFYPAKIAAKLSPIETLRAE